LNKKVMLVCGEDEHRFRDLLPFQVLDSVLGTFGLGPGEIHVVSSKRKIISTEYHLHDLIDPMRVAKLFAEGATVIFRALHRRHEPLRRLCAALASQSGFRTQANIYVTPPHSQGFRPHWDTHDVFILQIQGSKQWRIYAGGDDRPLAGREYDAEEHEAGAGEAEVTVSPEDTRYIPRGVTPASESRDDVSIHVTLGLIPYTWIELVTSCLAELALRDGSWRDCIPFGLGPDGERDADEVRAGLKDRLENVVEEMDVERVLRRHQDEISGVSRPCAGNYLWQANMGAEWLSENDTVQLRPELACRIEARDDRTVVVEAGRELDFPRIAEATLTEIVAKGRVMAGGIEDELDWASRKTILTTLIRAGIVETRGRERTAEEDLETS